MPILEITNEHLTQRCAACEAERTLGARDFRPIDGAGDVLALPACPCGAVEFLIGSPPNEPPHPSPGSFGHRHRLVVDALVDIVRASREPRAKLAVADEVSKRLGKETMQQWFPGGLTIEPSKPVTESPEPGNDEDKA